jgi:PAS domain S-box-containing protein
MSSAPYRQLTEGEHLFVAAVQSSDDAIVTMTLDGRVTTWNPAAERLFGYSAEEAVGSSIDLIIPDDRKKEMADELAAIACGEKIRHHETVRVAKGGSRLDLSLSISPTRAMPCPMAASS